ncbi:hypothetical protein DERP_013731 [Dermatophagoides pteronyssinus]|uniref:Uncharacterized protein n=1 Tax=Dermatophagoides pteronyssinus TaxID=6956 RepID=A0ABQ8JFA0_DERPT|nr:hypothetical protein DERP_013731 [Dermatophagoides pteronyssinus]
MKCYLDKNPEKKTTTEISNTTNFTSPGESINQSIFIWKQKLNYRIIPDKNEIHNNNALFPSRYNYV